MWYTDTQAGKINMTIKYFLKRKGNLDTDARVDPVRTKLEIPGDRATTHRMPMIPESFQKSGGTWNRPPHPYQNAT